MQVAKFASIVRAHAKDRFGRPLRARLVGKDWVRLAMEGLWRGRFGYRKYVVKLSGKEREQLEVLIRG